LGINIKLKPKNNGKTMGEHGEAVLRGRDYLYSLFSSV